MKKLNYKLFISISLSCVVYYSHATKAFNDTVDQLGNVELHSLDSSLFASDEPLEMSLYLDIREFLKTKKNPKYYDVLCTIKSGGDSVSKMIKIKARGEMRREYCHYPPIMLKIPDSESSIDTFPLYGKLKLVTPCMPSENYENYVLKEYLTYRLFNQVTTYSLKTRLVKISFADSKKPARNFTALGFLIENEKSMAERNEAVIIKNENLSQRNMEPINMTRVALFNYMIGNTDWSVPLQHNIKILKSFNQLTNKGIPVVYDFDYTGLVNAVYATPAEGLPIKVVRDRLYLGMCENHVELDRVVSEFEGLRIKFLNTINDFEYITPADRKNLESYINGFFKMYKNQNNLVNMLNSTCKR